MKREIKSLIANAIIEFVEKGQYGSFYSVNGLDDEKIRLFISHNFSDWKLVGFDPRGMWFDLGDRADLCNGLKPETTSFSSSIPELSMGYESGVDWLNAEILTQLN
jgi:hypothetical protein